MCGINGFYNYSGASLDDPCGLVEKMNLEIRHRGPDGNGVWAAHERGVYLGHQRLSILDLTNNGRQPMEGRNRSVIVFNGEIYNYRELKSGLPGMEFHSGTDTEVLLALYENQGAECLSGLNGMFAFAIWDENTRKLELVRDRLGIKPLYYTTVNGIFSFSSEIKSLLLLPWVRAELDEEALYDFLTFNRVAPPKTVFRHIRKLHPGHRMVVGKDGIECCEPYWEVDYSDYRNIGEEEIGDMLARELEQSVRYRMVSDVTVGAFLSGGVDSSAIVALMSGQQSEPVKTYSIGFDQSPDFDERQHAEMISARYGTEHHEKTVCPRDLVDFLPGIVDIYDEPLADATSIPMYFLSQLARENGTIVVLTGDGADELFCGYRNWMHYAKLYPYYNFLLSAPAALRKLIAGTYDRFGGNAATREILARLSKGQEMFWGGAGGFKESMKRSFLSAGYVERMEKKDSYDQIIEFRALFDRVKDNKGGADHVDWMTYVGMKYIVPNYYLYRADRMGMAQSVELRVPFLDHNFVNMAMSVPSGLKVKNGVPKYILKKSLEKTLPHSTLYRKKQGFCVPLQEWAGDIMLHYIEDNLAGFCSDTGLFDEQSMRLQVKATRAGKQDYVHTLWNFYFLMIWFRKWLM